MPMSERKASSNREHTEIPENLYRRSDAVGCASRAEREGVPDCVSAQCHQEGWGSGQWADRIDLITRFEIKRTRRGESQARIASAQSAFSNKG